MANDVIEVNNPRMAFDESIAVNDANLTVKQGEIFGFLGPNGTGKTTTIKVLTGLLSPSSGSTYINGIDVTEKPKLDDISAIYGSLKTIRSITSGPNRNETKKRERGQGA